MHPKAPAQIVVNAPAQRLWQRRQWLLSTALAWPLLGCGGGGGGSSAGAGGNTSPPPPSNGVATQVTLQSPGAGALLDSRYAGLSYEKSKLVTPFFSPSNSNLLGLLQRLGPGVLRLGGNSVDQSSWGGQAPGLTVLTQAQVSSLAAFVKACNWQVLYGINFANNTAANAASEAQFAAQQLGSHLLAFEIGNEPDDYDSNGLRPGGYTPAQFAGEWVPLAQAVQAAVPGVPLSGPAASHDLLGYTLPFAKAESGLASLLTQHYYRGSPLDPASTQALLLQADPNLPGLLAQVVGAAKSNHMALGFRFGECNSFNGAGLVGVSDSLASALWALDFMFTCAANGCVGVNFHAGASVHSNGANPYYTPLADNDQDVLAVRPLYYGMLLLAQAAQGQALAANVQAASALNFSAYGVARSDGGFNAVLLNKDTQAASVTLSLPQGATATQMQSTVLGGASLAATSGVTLAGATVGLDGSWSAPTLPRVDASAGKFQLNVAAGSAVLLRSV